MTNVIKRVFQVLGVAITLFAALSVVYNQRLDTTSEPRSSSTLTFSVTEDPNSGSPTLPPPPPLQILHDADTDTSPEDRKQILEKEESSLIKGQVRPKNNCLDPGKLVTSDIKDEVPRKESQGPLVGSLGNHGGTMVSKSSLGTLTEELMEKIRSQLKRIAQDFQDTPVRAYDRSNLPRNLTFRGKAIFRVIPQQYLPDYRSPCFRLPYTGSDTSLVCLPYAFLAGFPKCATTDLFKKIVKHPGIVETSKEPHWWTRTTFSRTSVLHYLNHQQRLVDEMEKSGNKQLITFDASASTIWDSLYSLGKFSALNRPLTLTHVDVMRAVIPDARAVVILRQPAERLYSGYMAFDKEWRAVKSPWDFHRRLLNSLRDFNACMQRSSLTVCANIPLDIRLSVGMYSIFIREWLKRFPRDQMHILRTDSWAENPSLELTKIFDFLKLDPIAPSTLHEITSTSKENKRERSDQALGGMLPETRRLLDTFYQPFNADLAQLMDDEHYLWEEGNDRE